MIEVKPNITDEVKLIPWWAISLAIAVFAGMQALMHVVLFPREPYPAPLALRVFTGLMWRGTRFLRAARRLCEPRCKKTGNERSPVDGAGDLRPLCHWVYHLFPAAPAFKEYLPQVRSRGGPDLQLLSEVQVQPAFHVPGVSSRCPGRRSLLPILCEGIDGRDLPIQRIEVTCKLCHSERSDPSPCLLESYGRPKALGRRASNLALKTPDRRDSASLVAPRNERPDEFFRIL